MAKLNIGLIGQRGDPQVVRLQEEVKRHGATPLPIDLTDIPRYANFHWHGDSLVFDDVDLMSLDSIYARTAYFPMPTSVPGMGFEEGKEATFVIRECGSLQNSIIEELASLKPFVNSPMTTRHHQIKPVLYSTLLRAGVPVPEFSVGCDLARAAHFVNDLEEDVVIKPLMGGEVFLADLAYLKEHHSEIDNRPFLLQRRIRGGPSMRAYVVGGEVVAAGQILHGDVIDWRNDTQGIEPLELGEEARKAVVGAIDAVGLIFGACDIEEDADGRPWIIDVNPGPMFFGFEQQTGLDVAGPLVKKLISLAGDALANDSL